jgi:hypothetical protein
MIFPKKKSNQILKNQYCIFDLTKLNNYIKKYNLDYEINILQDLYKNIGGIIYISNEININTYIFTISNYIFWNIKDLDHSNLIDQFNFILQKSVSSKTNENIKNTFFDILFCGLIILFCSRNFCNKSTSFIIINPC